MENICDCMCYCLYVIVRVFPVTGVSTLTSSAIVFPVRTAARVGLTTQATAVSVHQVRPATTVSTTLPTNVSHCRVSTAEPASTGSAGSSACVRRCGTVSAARCLTTRLKVEWDIA